MKIATIAEIEITKLMEGLRGKIPKAALWDHLARSDRFKKLSYSDQTECLEMVESMAVGAGIISFGPPSALIVTRPRR